MRRLNHCVKQALEMRGHRADNRAPKTPYSQRMVFTHIEQSAHAGSQTGTLQELLFGLMRGGEILCANWSVGGGTTVRPGTMTDQLGTQA